jgi:hypothetical protein
MKTPIHMLLICAAILLFLFAGLGDVFYRSASPGVWPWSGRLIAWGLFCWALSEIVTV